MQDSSRYGTGRDGMNEDKQIRLKWSDLTPYSPIRIVITDWTGVQKKSYGKGEYMLVPAMLEYGAHPVELCIPYTLFVKKLRKLNVGWQKMIVAGNAVVEIEKTARLDNFGMVIRKVERYNPI